MILSDWLQTVVGVTDYIATRMMNEILMSHHRGRMDTSKKKKKTQKSNKLESSMLKIQERSHLVCNSWYDIHSFTKYM